MITLTELTLCICLACYVWALVMLRRGELVELEKWIGAYKVRAFPWIDGKRIYFNVQYYAPGQSMEKPAVWEKTVYVTANTAGQRLVYEFTDSLVRHVADMQMAKDVEITFTVR